MHTKRAKYRNRIILIIANLFPFRPWFISFGGARRTITWRRDLEPGRLPPRWTERLDHHIEDVLAGACLAIGEDPIRLYRRGFQPTCPAGRKGRAHPARAMIAPPRVPGGDAGRSPDTRIARLPGAPREGDAGVCPTRRPGHRARPRRSLLPPFVHASARRPALSPIQGRAPGAAPRL